MYKNGLSIVTLEKQNEDDFDPFGLITYYDSYGKELTLQGFRILNGESIDEVIEPDIQELAR